MNTAVAVLEAQNKLLAEQNRLLKELKENQQAAFNMAPVDYAGKNRMMTEHDLLLIVMADDVLGAIDRWNSRRG